MSIRRIRSKWKKTAALLASSRLRELVPETRKFNRSALEQMLGRYGMVYVKPVNGTFGKGVIRVERTTSSPQAWKIHYGEKIVRYTSFPSMFRKILAIKRKRPYIVQQGIHLLTKSGRLFDLRVMVQKNLRNRWETTGIIGRLGHPKRPVTNYHSGGTPMSAEKLLGRRLGSEKLRYTLDRLRELGTLTAEVMERRFPGIKEIGLDIGLDKSLIPWILEVNTAPDPFIFRKHPDPSVFRKIYRYAAAYGRFRKRRNGRVAGRSVRTAVKRARFHRRVARR
jgi:hypothetical protein